MYMCIYVYLETSKGHYTSRSVLRLDSSDKSDKETY